MVNTPGEVITKINEFSSSLNELNAQKRSRDVTDQNTAFVDKLYDGFTKLQNNSQVLGVINDRLECVKMIHEENAEIGNTMKTINSNQGEVGKLVTENRGLLDKVKLRKESEF